MLEPAVRRISALVYVVGQEQLGETFFTYAQKVSLAGGHFCSHYTTGHAPFSTRYAHSHCFEIFLHNLYRCKHVMRLTNQFCYVAAE